MHHLAEVTQDTVYLSERSNLEAVCTNRALGDFPIQAIPLDIGIRRPLGVGAGGLAMLCAMPEAEAEAIIQANGHRYEKFASFTADFLRSAVSEGRARGYAFLDSVTTPGAASIGVAFPANDPVAAIVVTAISGRLPIQRREEIVREMHRQVAKISAAMTNAASVAKPPLRHAKAAID